jgi:hypothetical protein
LKACDASVVVDPGPVGVEVGTASTGVTGGVDGDVEEGTADVDRVVGARVVWVKEVVSCAKEEAGRTSARKRKAVDRGR